MPTSPSPTAGGLALRSPTGRWVLLATVLGSGMASLDATVRRTLEDHCQESDNFRAENLFEMVEGKGAGIWGLRNR